MRLHREGPGADGCRRRRHREHPRHIRDDWRARTSTSSTPRRPTIRSTLDFDATAKQPQRSLAPNGSLLLHPDHQEIHLQRLGLTSQGVQWQPRRTSQAAIQTTPRRDRGEEPRARQRRSADCGGRHVRPSRRRLEGHADQHRSRQRRRAPAASAAAFRDRRTRPAPSPATRTARESRPSFRSTQGGFRHFPLRLVQRHASTMPAAGLTRRHAGCSRTPRRTSPRRATCRSLSFQPASPRRSARRRTARARRPRIASTSTSKHADRSRSGAGFHDVADQRHRHAAGEYRRHRFGRRSASRPASSASSERGVHRRTDRRASTRTCRGKHRSAARQGAHRQHLGARQPSERPLDYRRPRGARDAARRRRAVTSPRSDFKVIDNKLGNVRINTDLRAGRRVAGAADRRRLRNRDRARQPRRDPRVDHRIRPTRRNRPEYSTTAGAAAPAEPARHDTDARR